MVEFEITLLENKKYLFHYDDNALIKSVITKMTILRKLTKENIIDEIKEYLKEILGPEYKDEYAYEVFNGKNFEDVLFDILFKYHNFNFIIFIKNEYKEIRRKILFNTHDEEAFEFLLQIFNLSISLYKYRNSSIDRIIDFIELKRKEYKKMYLNN